ncbi:MAG TPA: pyridoxal-phosphate dependent enzyme, partial [Limnochordales bacterium]
MDLARPGHPLARHPLLGLVGNTPMVRLQRLWPQDHPVAVSVKLEAFNPGGSVKDRPALYMVARALQEGRLEGRSLLDATSGNTGIAYAMIGAALGLRVTVCLPANASEERRLLLQAFGARVVLTDPLEGSEGARVEARRLAERYPDEFCWLDQYNNPANPQAHYETTGPEIWRDTGGRVTHLVAGAGTGGTLMGTGRYLKERRPQLQVVAVQPDNPLHGLEGLKHMETADVPGIYRPEQVDRVEYVTTE